MKEKTKEAEEIEIAALIGWFAVMAALIAAFVMTTPDQTSAECEILRTEFEKAER